MTHTQIAEKIIGLLQIPGSHYFMVTGENDSIIKIRVSDHSAKRQNNGDVITLSFISQRCDQGYSAMVNEWVIDEDGYTDTYQSIQTVLEWNGVIDKTLQNG